MKTPEISVVISTYNALPWLKKVLWGYAVQSFQDFELVIADDGSTEDTAQFIQEFAKTVSFDVLHVWQEDNGFQKSQILNKALEACNASYVVMSDGDCIPRKDFLAVHQRYRAPGYFLSGGYFMLPMSTSTIIDQAAIESGLCFTKDWLMANDLKASFKLRKLTSGAFMAKILNAVTPTNASWNGHNASGWKKDLLAINGFDQRMQYGGQDRELGERLINLGIKSKQIRYSAICIHLDHPRGYKNEASIAKNRGIRQETRHQKSTWTAYGIHPGPKS
ncbi:MAG: glycosyltransferase family 2 protein [Flavobacteriaceae bacterium]|nr:glycosyltransferase family 2 protein [Flavobacteriaceae bacterium]MDG1063627.1 glycosyltransferase family 2 protein [Flavobacteriaceae bacterium]MDG1962070.1 glycosyltransferase family 2 protein [Flavobacteriaceae bacterium]